MFKRLIASLVCLTFIFSNFQYAHAQVSPATGGDFSINQLPVPGTMVGQSAPFAPITLKGIVVNPQKPLEFQFIVDTGRGPKDTVTVKDQANQLVKYFLAGLTIPEEDLWVNLSPYEKNRMVPEALGQTDLGRDLLAQDYILKQLTATLIYPEKDLGKEFWRKVYTKAQKQFGTTNVPVNTFNKVWILPNQAQVFENNNAAYVTKSTLKVMLDEDYLATEKNQRQPGDMFKSELQRTCPQAACQASKPLNMKATQGASATPSIGDLGKQIIKEIILPEIEKEVNTGKNFAPLRQIYQALILAKWYKETIQNGLLDAVYTNKNKIRGVNLHDLAIKEQIYNRYLQAYKKGVFNYIKEESDSFGQTQPRKYFSGGTLLKIDHLDRDGAMSAIEGEGNFSIKVILNAHQHATSMGLSDKAQVTSVEFSHDIVEKVINVAAQELQKFLRFVNNPGLVSDYLAGRNENEVQELIKKYPEIVLAAREFSINEEKYSRENLLHNGNSLVPDQSFRIELDAALDGSIRQILFNGIPDPFRAIAKSRMEKALGSDLFISIPGRTSIEIKAQKVNKNDAVSFLENNFDTVLDEMGYGQGVINVRQTRTVIAIGGDGTLWSAPNIGDMPTFSDSITFGPIIEYLKMGGVLQIITGDSFKRSLDRIEGKDGVPVALRRQIILSTSGGATFYVYDKDGHLKEFPDYKFDVLRQDMGSGHQKLDILYIGDDESKEGSDYVVFKNVGFGRSVLVTDKPFSLVPEELRRSYVGRNHSGTKDVLEAVVRIIRRHATETTSSYFKDDSADIIKDEIIQGSLKKIEDNISWAGRVSGDVVGRSLETLSVGNNIVFIQGDQHEGERDAKEVAQRLALNAMNTKAYQIDLDGLNFTDPSTPERVVRLIRKMAPSQGRIVILMKGIEKYAVNFNKLGELINDPRIITIGVTSFEGYRSLETGKNVAKDLHFIITEPEEISTDKEKRIAVIGASGFLGERMFNFLHSKARNETDVLGTGFSKTTQFIPLDVTDEENIREFFSKNKVDVVIYSAGEADADKTKKDMPRAMALNADVVSLIKKYFKGKFVYISTEYVFDGQDNTAPYTTTSQGNPVNEYGLTKVEGEKLTSKEFVDSIILRIGVLYGYNHPSDKMHFAKDVLEKLKNGQDFAVDDKQLKRPVMTDDVAWTVRKLIQHDARGTFHINGFEPMTKYQEAIAIAQVYYQMFPDARRVVISPTYTVYTAPRPPNTFMINSDTPRLFDRGAREMIVAAQENEDISPLRNEDSVVTSKATEAREVQLDRGEKRIFDAIQKKVRDGTLTLENLPEYNQVKGKVEPDNNIESLPQAGTAEHQRLVKLGAGIKDAIGFSMGGLSTRSGGRMRMGFRFVLKDVDPKAHSLIEWKLGNVRDYNNRHPSQMKPVLIMTSQATEGIYRAISRTMNGFGLMDSGLFNFDNGLQQRISFDQNDPSFGKVARRQNGEIITNPPGHYAFIRQMVISGVLARLKREGVQMIYHSNMNNFGAVVNEEYDASKGLFWEEINKARKAGRKIPMSMVEVVDNDHTETGSYPALVNGNFSLLRAEMMPKGVDIEQFNYFNTGNYFFYIDAILSKLGLSENYDQQLNKNAIALRFDTVFDIKPIVSRKIYEDLEQSGQTNPVMTLQIERYLDDLLAQAPVVVVRVPNDRFIAVKTEDEFKKEKERLTRALQGNVDVRYEPFRVRHISDADKKAAVTSFIRFRDYIRHQVWGGRWILGLKGLKWDDETIASESVEMSSYAGFPSIMILESGQRMEITDVGYFGFANNFFGKRVVEKYGAQIPFILKFLDAQNELSIQVHPTDEQARRLEGDPDSKGKEENFVVVNAEEKNDFILGLNDKATPEKFRQAVRDQDPRIEGMLNHITVRPGDVYRVPSGTPHAFQHGIQAIEIGHMSDLTYRLYDYNRQNRYPKKYGNRDTHITQGLASVNFDLLQGKDLIRNLKKNWRTVKRLLNNAGEIQSVDVSPGIYAERIMLKSVGENKGEIIEPITIVSDTKDRFHALMGVKGAVLLKRVADGQTTILQAGQTVFIPAKLGKYEIISMSPQPTIVYRFYPQFEDEYPKMNIGISVGGSKFIFGLVDRKGHVSADSEFNWREKLKGEVTTEKIETMIMDEISRLLRRFSVYPEQIDQIGIAWPGPVNYNTQLVTATYLPFSGHALSDVIQQRFLQQYNHRLQVYAVLDVQADVLGELKDAKGGLKGKSNGLVLNIATGIAAGVLKDNQLIDEIDYVSGNGDKLHINTGFPQVGRHLVRPKNAPTEWEYRPTSDGAVPSFSDKYERFSRTCGGPFIAKRFVASLIERLGRSDKMYFTDIPMDLGNIAASLENRENDSSAVDLEGQVLSELTRKAYTDDGFAQEFLSDIGLEIGSAMGVFIRSYPNIFNAQNNDLDLILVGGIGENLGNPELLVGVNKYKDDIFLKAVQKGLQNKGVSGVRVKRSVVDRNGRRVREVIAFQTQEDFRVLLKELGAHPTREQYHSTFERLTKTSLGYLWMPISLTTQDALGKEKEYQITVPSQMLSEKEYRTYLVNYLALLLNIQGELRGLSSYSVKVWGNVDSTLLDDVVHKLKEDFPLTNERVNFGRPIVHEKVLENNPQIQNVKDADVVGKYLVRKNNLGPKTVVVNVLGTGLGISGFIKGKMLKSLFAAHIKEDMSPQAKQGVAGLQGDLENLVNANFIVRRANELAGEEKFSNPEDVQLDEAIAKKVYYELGENLARFYQEFMKQYDLDHIDCIFLTGGLMTSKYSSYTLLGLKSKLKKWKIDVKEIKIAQESDMQEAQESAYLSAFDRSIDRAQNASPGGIDLKSINVTRTNKLVTIQFDPAQLKELTQSGFEGFTPVIINITPIQSPFQLLGIGSAKKEELSQELAV
jgi:dTDP-4-dehydrorhamnose reductase